MRFLSLFFRLCLHVAIAYSLFKRQNIDGGLFDSTLDSTLFSNQPSVAALGPLDQTLTPDYGLFSNGNLDLAQSTEPDFLALGMGCDTSNANGIQMFDKRRREATCQTDTPGDSVDGSVERNLESAFTKAQTALLFKSESKICPPEIFGPSNIPVCSKDESMNISLLGLPWANLWDVDPVGAPVQCLHDPAKFWCCAEVEADVDKNVITYAAWGCYPQDLIEYGIPVWVD